MKESEILELTLLGAASKESEEFRDEMERHLKNFRKIEIDYENSAQVLALSLFMMEISQKLEGVNEKTIDSRKLQ